jgi:two-component system OmpR family response regulator
MPGALQRPITLLVVEDHDVLRETVARALAEQGYAVTTAATGSEAIDILWREKERIDWLFTDVRLPGPIDGFRVAEEFRFAHPLRPVVYATASRFDGARMVPGSIFFQKPYRPSDIVAAFQGLSESDRNGADLGMPRLRAPLAAAGLREEPKRDRSG